MRRMDTCHDQPIDIRTSHGRQTRTPLTPTRERRWARRPRRDPHLPRLLGLTKAGCGTCVHELDGLPQRRMPDAPRRKTRVRLCWAQSSQKDKGVQLPYLCARTSKKELATPPSGPNVGTVGHHTPSGKLSPLTKDISKEDPTCNTVYVAAVRPTGSCWQDI